MAREINLDGSEITIIKTLGVGGAEVSGEQLLEKIPNMDINDIGSILRDLISLGYVDSDRNSFYATEEFMKCNFQVNPGYAKELKHALDPEEPKPKSRRVRRE
jgi:hypothetical protein